MTDAEAEGERKVKRGLGRRLMGKALTTPAEDLS